MKTMLDIQKLLKQYGIFIYTGDRMGDLALMQMEIDDLFKANIIPPETYRQCRLLLANEKRMVEKEEK